MARDWRDWALFIFARVTFLFLSVVLGGYVYRSYLLDDPDSPDKAEFAFFVATILSIAFCEFCYRFIGPGARQK